MVAVMHGFEPLGIDVGVNLGGGHVGVAEQLLDDAQVCAVAQQMRGEGVPQEMGVDVYLEAGVQGDALEDLPDADGGQFRAAHGEEYLAAGALFDHAGTLFGEVFGDGFARLPAHGDEAGFVALAGDADDALFEQEVFEAGIGKLRDAEAAGVEQFHHGAVAQA